MCLLSAPSKKCESFLPVQNDLIIYHNLYYMEMDLGEHKENAKILGPFAKGKYGNHDECVKNMHRSRKKKKRLSILSSQFSAHLWSGGVQRFWKTSGSTIREDEGTQHHGNKQRGVKSLPCVWDHH